MPRFLNRAAGTFIGLLLIVAVGQEMLKFAQLAEAYLGVPPTSDATLFLAMGRAWLNGLHLYRDLFETKPPGVFLAAALALRMYGGFTLLVWFQLVLLATLPVALAWFSAKAVERESPFHRWLVIASTLLLGLAVADETLFRSGGYLAEGFGLLFATIPALAIAGQPTTRQLGREAVAGISLGIAVMFMEPFGLSGLELPGVEEGLVITGQLEPVAGWGSGRFLRVQPCRNGVPRIQRVATALT